MSFQIDVEAFTGPGGRLTIDDHDEVLRRIAMLIQGECEAGPSAAARMFGFCRQRYFQLRALFWKHGTQGLIPRPPGPKRNYRRTNEVVCQVIRHRFLDPDASAGVIAQKLRQAGFSVRTHSIERIFAEFGLQKNSISTDPTGRLSSWRPFGQKEQKEQRPPIPKVSNAAFAKCWRIKHPATCWAYGSWFLSIYA